MIVIYDTDTAELRRENRQLRDRLIPSAQGSINMLCAEQGHDWERHNYCFPDDTNPSTCRRCGAEKCD